MLCEQCFLRNALVHITNIRSGTMTTRHLCEECAAEEPFSLMNLGKIMRGLVFVIEGPPETKQKTRPRLQKDLQCAQCNYRAADFQKTQRLGCPACYEVFKEFLDLKDIKPKEMPPLPLPPELSAPGPAEDTSKNPAGHWEELQSRLYRALKAENYEEAARLRDELRMALGSSALNSKK